MNNRETCYGCDYAFSPEELTDYIDAQFPEGIKLCEECARGVGQ